MRVADRRLVYNVQEGDYEGFIAALEAAMRTPIDP